MADNWCKAALGPLLLERQRGVAQLCQASTLPLWSAHALLTIIRNKDMTKTRMRFYRHHPSVVGN